MLEVPFRGGRGEGGRNGSQKYELFVKTLSVRISVEVKRVARDHVNIDKTTTESIYRPCGDLPRLLLWVEDPKMS